MAEGEWARQVTDDAVISTLQFLALTSFTPSYYIPTTLGMGMWEGISSHMTTFIKQYESLFYTSPYIGKTNQFDHIFLSFENFISVYGKK